MAASTKWAWSLNNPINPDFLAPRGSRAIASFAILAALLLHALLLLLVFQNTVTIQPRPPMSVDLVRIPPPPVVQPLIRPPPPVVKPIAHPPPAVVKPIPHPPPAVVVPIKPKPALPRLVVRHAPPRTQRYTPPKIHVAPANQNDGLGLGLDLTTPDAGTGQGSMDGFEASVRGKILAAKTYPPGTKGLWNECVVNYRVTVDRGGDLISYKLYGCGNPFLDAASRAAILLAAPFPVPPNFGGSQYNVFGSLVYQQQ